MNIVEVFRNIEKWFLKTNTNAFMYIIWTNKYTYNWDDAIYLGQLYRYYGAFTKPI